MQLCQARLVGVGPIADITFPFVGDEGAPRASTVVLGGSGTGKTSLLAAIAATRPGYAVPPAKSRAPFAVTDWLLGEDDPARPHPLRVASPHATIEERDDDGVLRRREQAHFEKRAAEKGFAFVAFSGARWFSRAPVALASPERSVGRYDVKTVWSFDDPTRADLTRETKATLSYGAIAGALARQAAPPGVGREPSAAEELELAVKDAVAPLARLAGFAFAGVDPLSLEPLFEAQASGAVVTFDDLPGAARHLVAFGAVTARVLFAARAAEGVALIDDADLHQDTEAQRALLPALRAALPGVQWILASKSPAVALSCAPEEVLALRRMPDADEVRLYAGEQALVH
jgi:hypothetical protein